MCKEFGIKKSIEKRAGHPKCSTIGLDWMRLFLFLFRSGVDVFVMDLCYYVLETFSAYPELLIFLAST